MPVDAVGAQVLREPRVFTARFERLQDEAEQPIQDCESSVFHGSFRQI